MTPSIAFDLLSANFLSSALPSTSYARTDLKSPPASRRAPSAEYASVLNALPAAAFAADRKSPTVRPPAASRRPSIVPSNRASSGFHRKI
jgi:hypothetical protein